MMLLPRKMAGHLSALLLIILATATANVYAAEPSSALLKAKKEAEAKGFLFAASHDEIVSKAKQEGKLRVIVSLDAGILKKLSEGFTKKYPFIQVQADEIRGIEAYTRQLQELKAGLVKGVDVNEVDYDYYNEYLPHLKKVDMYGMAEHGIIQMPLQMVDPINRNIVAVGSGIQVAAHHKKLLPADSVPDTWEGFLKPEFKERKFTIGIRPKDVAALVPAWGLEKTLDFARKLAAQNPIWISGDTRTITSMLAGEYALFFGPNLRFRSASQKQRQDRCSRVQACRAGYHSAQRIGRHTGFSRAPLRRAALVGVCGFSRGPESPRRGRTVRGLGLYSGNRAGESCARQKAIAG